MPELPEVEVTRRGLLDLRGAEVVECTVRRFDLREPVPPQLHQALQGARLQDLTRRGKYLLFQFDRQGREGVMMLHLGMSGSLEFVPDKSTPWLTHQHLEWCFRYSDGGLAPPLRFHDPRRFGALWWQDQSLEAVLAQHPRLTSLGPEPWDPNLDDDSFYRTLKKHASSIKAVLLGGKAIVGVGNIYAAEALFLAGIAPLRQANSLSKARCSRLLLVLRQVLQAAIAEGGSSIRDFRAVNGASGYFQQNYFVYARAGEPCRHCHSPICSISQNQRTSFYCRRCQK